MTKIEKRCRIKVNVNKRTYPDTRLMLEFGIGVLIPVRWIDKTKGEIIRKLPIVEIDISNRSKPVFVLDASVKYNSRLIQHTFNQILEYCFDYLEDIPMSDYSHLIDSVKIDEYIAITHNNHEYLVDDIVKVNDCNMAYRTGRICEINAERNTFTIDTSEDAKSSSQIYSIDNVISIELAPE